MAKNSEFSLEGGRQFSIPSQALWAERNRNKFVFDSF